MSQSWIFIIPSPSLFSPSMLVIWKTGQTPKGNTSSIIRSVAYTIFFHSEGCNNIFWDCSITFLCRSQSRRFLSTKQRRTFSLPERKQKSPLDKTAVTCTHNPYTLPLLYIQYVPLFILGYYLFTLIVIYMVMYYNLIIFILFINRFIFELFRLCEVQNSDDYSC